MTAQLTGTGVSYPDGTCQSSASYLVPAGTMAPFVAGTQPAGWICLSGCTVLRCQYPNLYNVIGPRPDSCLYFNCVINYVATNLSSIRVGKVGNCPFAVYTGMGYGYGGYPNWSSHQAVGLDLTYGSIYNLGCMCCSCGQISNSWYPSSCSYAFMVDALCNMRYVHPSTQNNGYISVIPTAPKITGMVSYGWFAYGGCNCIHIYGSRSSNCIAYSQTANGICCYTSICVASDCFHSVVSLNNCLFVASPTNGSGYLFMSTNGCNWTCYTNIPSSMCTQCTSLASANGLILMTLTSNAPVWTSCDGCTWTNIGNLDPSVYRICDLSYCCGYYYSSTLSGTSNWISALSLNLTSWPVATCSQAGYGCCGFVMKSPSCLYTTGSPWYGCCTCFGVSPLPFSYNPSQCFKLPYNGNQCGVPTSCFGCWSYACWYIKT